MRPSTIHAFLTLARHTCCATALALPTAVPAQAPTFHCAKAQGVVEKLICADAALATLDRQLADVYQAAGAMAQGKLATQLRNDQRSWVKGRNDCWKANGQETWITATWTVKTVKDCVDAQYRLRMSELQAVWRLLPPRTVSHACQGNPANEVVANFFDTKPPTLRLERGDRTITLWQVGAAADARYEGQNVDVRQQGATLAVNWLDTRTGKTAQLDCKAQ